VSDPFYFLDLRQASAVPPWPATHAEKANIRMLQFKPVEAPNSKLPTSSETSNANTKSQCRTRLEFDRWRFIEAWMLGYGASDMKPLQRAAENLFLRPLHFARFGGGAVVESVQM
jgi:hypothetical protein